MKKFFSNKTLSTVQMLLLGTCILGMLFYASTLLSNKSSDAGAFSEAQNTFSQDAYENERVIINSEIDSVGAKAAYKKFKLRHGSKDESEVHEYAHIFGEILYKDVGIPGVSVCDAGTGVH